MSAEKMTIEDLIEFLRDAARAAAAARSCVGDPINGRGVAVQSGSAMVVAAGGKAPVIATGPADVPVPLAPPDDGDDSGIDFEHIGRLAYAAHLAYERWDTSSPDSDAQHMAWHDAKNEVAKACAAAMGDEP